MNKFVSTCLLFVFSMSSSLFALDANDQESILKIIDHITLTWNDQGGHGFADDYAQDADFVNIYGSAFSGNQEIETRHVYILETFLKGTHFEVDQLSLREAQPGVVIAHVYWKLSNVPQVNIMKGIMTHVLLNNDGRWEITATQNTLTAGK